MQIRLIPVTMFQSNCVVVWDEQTMDGVCFDTGGEAENINKFLAAQGIKGKGIYLTHGHVDHVAGTNKVKKATGAEVYMHADDKPIAERTSSQCMMFGIPAEEAPGIDHEVNEGDAFEFSGLKFSVMHTPGHSPGSVCYYFADGKTLVCGDLLFAGSIGRMDLPGGSQAQMKASLERLKKMDNDITVISGHGPQTSIGNEKARNPYLTGGMLSW